MPEPPSVDPAIRETGARRAAAPAVELLLRFARAGHAAGYPTAELEERILALADSLGLGEAQVSATPTVVEVSLGSLPHQRSYTLRVRPADRRPGRDRAARRPRPGRARRPARRGRGARRSRGDPGHAARAEVADPARRLRARRRGADAGARRRLARGGGRGARGARRRRDRGADAAHGAPRADRRAGRRRRSQLLRRDARRARPRRGARRRHARRPRDVPARG